MGPFSIMYSVKQTELLKLSKYSEFFHKICAHYSAQQVTSDLASWYKGEGNAIFQMLPN